MKVCGWDAGKEGALALVTVETGECRFFDNPLTPDREHDTHKAFMTLLEFEPDVICTEITIRPIPLVRHTGEIMAVAKILQAELFLFPVNTWKKRMLGEVTSDKQKSIDRALAIKPDLQLIRPRGRKPSHDRSEAFLLAQYYLTTLNRGPTLDRSSQHRAPTQEPQEREAGRGVPGSGQGEVP